MSQIKNNIRSSFISTLKPVKSIVKSNSALKRVTKNLLLEMMTISNSAENLRYHKWLQNNYPNSIKLFDASNEMKNFKYNPKISILTPTYNTNLEYLNDCIKSVQSQIYQNWELCIVDDASTEENVRQEIILLAKDDNRIKYKFRTSNGHISKASNDALGMASGEFVGLLDHDDILWPNALFEVVKALNKDKRTDFIYSDEEKVHLNSMDHQNPFFKPDWNPEFLESVNYITHFAVLRKSLVDKIGGFRSKFDGAQDWDLFLRAAYATKFIHHIPTVLYSWRMSETSTAYKTDTKPYVTEAQHAVLTESLKARGNKAKVVRGMAKDYWSVEYALPKAAKVSIVIPTKNQLNIVKRCINSIYKKTTYKNFEIILIDTGSTDKRVFRWYKKLEKEYKNFHVFDWTEKPFSYARTCNFGAKKASGDYLLMLNNDTEVITPSWIELLLSDAQRSDVGPVGCKLYYPGGSRIQHGGVGIGLGGYAGNLLSTLHKNELSPLQHLYANTRHAVSAVTAACMLIKKDRFEEVSGFDEQFSVTYNDVDLCLRLGKAGYRSVYNPSVELIHHESISLGLPSENKKRDTDEFIQAKELFKKRWAEFIDRDPQLNPNIDHDNAWIEINSEEVINTR